MNTAKIVYTSIRQYIIDFVSLTLCVPQVNINVQVQQQSSLMKYTILEIDKLMSIDHNILVNLLRDHAYQNHHHNNDVRYLCINDDVLQDV